jgi:hypothetical protein
VTELVLDCPREEAREIIVAAFEQTDGISKIESNDFQVVGKTGMSFPRVLWSYGEIIYVDISESENEDKTPISVRGESKVSINIGSNPDKFKRRFLDEVNKIRQK